MTTGPTDTDRRQDAVTSATSNANWRMRQAVTEIAEAGGAQVRERSLFPGSISVDRYAEPLAGVRAAGVLADTAARIAASTSSSPAARRSPGLRSGRRLAWTRDPTPSAAMTWTSPRSSTSPASLACGIKLRLPLRGARASTSPTAARMSHTQKTGKAVTAPDARGSRPSWPPGRPNATPGTRKTRTEPWAIADRSSQSKARRTAPADHPEPPPAASRPVPGQGPARAPGRLPMPAGTL
jgi:hypothetical protein